MLSRSGHDIALYLERRRLVFTASRDGACFRDRWGAGDGRRRSSRNRGRSGAAIATTTSQMRTRVPRHRQHALKPQQRRGDVGTHDRAERWPVLPRSILRLPFDLISFIIQRCCLLSFAQPSQSREHGERCLPISHWTQDRGARSDLGRCNRNPACLRSTRSATRMHRQACCCQRKTQTASC